jgi:DNA-binding response OmpR family regulator
MKNGNKILLVEDDKFISRAYKDGLERGGFEVTHTVDGEEAMKLARKIKPDIILLDLIIKKKNGFEVLEEIKLDKTLRKTPVVILSNLGQKSDIKKGMNLGAADYLIKTSFTVSEVIEKVKYHLVAANKKNR